MLSEQKEQSLTHLGRGTVSFCVCVCVCLKEFGDKVSLIMIFEN